MVIVAIMLMLLMSYGHCSHNVDVMDVLWSLYAIMLMLWMSYGHCMP